MIVTSIDFETANHSDASICAAGLAVFENGQLTACTLNFRAGLDQLPPGDRLDQKTVSTLLYVVNQRFGGGERRALTPEAVGADGETG